MCIVYDLNNSSWNAVVWSTLLSKTFKVICKLVFLYKYCIMIREDFLSHYAGQKLLSDNFKKRESNAESRKQILYESSSHAVGVFKVLDSLRKYVLFY